MTTPRTLTSAEWWARTKADPERLLGWLKKQYVGEETAHERIEAFRAEFAIPGSFEDRTLKVIADQESKHASWIRVLLDTRGVDATQLTRHDARYWSEVVGGIDSFENGCAVGAHAEAMRLERIRAIANDADAPKDIQNVFQSILPDEEFHERAFRKFATDEALAAASPAHAEGLNALGLTH